MYGLEAANRTNHSQYMNSFPPLTVTAVLISAHNEGGARCAWACSNAAASVATSAPGGGQAVAARAAPAPPAAAAYRYIYVYSILHIPLLIITSGTIWITMF